MKYTRMPNLCDSRYPANVPYGQGDESPLGAFLKMEVRHFSMHILLVNFCDSEPCLVISK